MKKFATVVSSCLFMLCFSTIASGQADIGFKGIGGRLGFVMPESDIGNTMGMGVQADLGTITKDVHLGALVDYWTKAYDGAGGDLTEIVIAATAKYFFKMDSKFEPYAGGGLGFTYGRSSWESGEIHEGSASDTDIGFHVVGGVEYPLSPNLKGLAELTYHIDGADYLGIFAGVTYLLAK